MDVTRQSNISPSVVERRIEQPNGERKKVIIEGYIGQNDLDLEEKPIIGNVLNSC